MKTCHKNVYCLIYLLRNTILLQREVVLINISRKLLFDFVMFEAVLVHGARSSLGFKRGFFVCFRRGGGGRLPRGREGHGSSGGPDPGRGADHALHHHLLLACPGYAVRKTNQEERGGESSKDLELLQGRKKEVLRTFDRAPPSVSAAMLQTLHAALWSSSATFLPDPCIQSLLMLLQPWTECLQLHEEASHRDVVRKSWHL